MSSVDDANDDGLSIGYIITSGTGYIIINIFWIAIEFQVSSSDIYIRSKYGDNTWSGWSTIA